MLLVPSAFALGAVLVYAVTFWQLPATEDPGAWGTFGDFLGGLLNPLVSTLTLFVAASVWRLQRKELALTRQALEQTKDAKNMIPLVEKYGLLQHLHQGHLRTELKKRYPKVFDSNAVAPAALLLTGP